MRVAKKIVGNFTGGLQEGCTGIQVERVRVCRNRGGEGEGVQE